MGEEFRDPGYEGLAIAQFALPDDQALPAHTAKSPEIVLVARLVSSDFILPICYPRLRNTGEPAFMSVPKATVDENHFPLQGENEVWSAREIRSM